MACAFVAATGTGTTAGYGAAVVQRGSANATTSRPTVSRTNNAGRMPTLMAQPSVTPSAPETTPDPTTPTPDDPTPETPTDTAPVVIENKSSQFDATLAGNSATNTDATADARAEMIRRQRAALDAADATTAANNATANSVTSGLNNCDAGLRACMMDKCGRDYSKCAGDGDTIWGDKMDACRRSISVQCTGEDYRMFAAEIKADRDLNAKLASYNDVIDCGNQYNDCILTQCGTTFNKCLGRMAENAAIAACDKIARECLSADNGLANRTMQVLATLRQDAEVQVKKDEQRLYALRDQMVAQCSRLGAMFDERSLDCVYTVNFFANNSSTPYASKKAYAGSTFDCTQNWFGVDITTFKENAFRLTREQQSATSAMLGAGLGTAAGAISSGAINRAMDRQKADNALKKAEKEHAANYGDKKSDKSGDMDAKDKIDNSKTTNNQAQTPAQQSDTQNNNTVPGAQSGGANAPLSNNSNATQHKTRMMPDECNTPKRWHSLASFGVSTFLAGGVHQPESRGKLMDSVVKPFQSTCENAGGTFAIMEREYKVAKNVCGTYNKYDAVWCKFSTGDTSSGSTRCKQIFGRYKHRDHVSQNGINTENLYTACELTYGDD